MKYETFDEFLSRKCEEGGGFEGVLDDDYPDAFEKWLETKEGDWLVQYGNEYGRSLVAQFQKVV